MSKPTKKVKISRKEEKEERKAVEEDYSSADSEDEEKVLTIGRAPLKWYDEFRHLGYDIESKKVEKEKQSWGLF